MKVADISSLLEKIAPVSNAESFDNVGLLVGNQSDNIKGILITLDCLEEVVEEAIHCECNLIVTFHPIIFSGLKSITGKNYVEKAVIKAIRNNINIYAIHTNLDIAKEGVNYEIAKRLGVHNLKPLIPKIQGIKKIQTYVPVSHVENVQKALFESGAGEIGNYKNCSFKIEGKGSFLPTENSQPYIGEINKPEEVDEIQVSVIFEDYKQYKILNSLRESHPYEEIAYEIYTLENENQDLGMGRIGELEYEISETDFLQKLKLSLPTKCIRHTSFTSKKVKKVALLGGSGSFAIKKAIAAGADAFVTSDIKYHEFFQAEGKILLADIGHYESEQFTKNLLFNYLKNYISESCKMVISEVKTNPVKYFL
ncbi:Nif3-like dinuclear metal center hexameric protein [Apibacter raozihei]|uniref:Nif3-like dinuclear metal center hexameric protein n=1 Tax=Apibacter raozihei TaxID=2500547 RepID=UPI000FE40581|nr:Nif3-like dinuclear metal center hexameric protein [Apibacter raozihei]